MARKKQDVQSTPDPEPYRKFTPEQMVAALTDSGGMVATAARKLGCHRATVMRYLDEYPEVREARQNARELLGDRAEATLATLALGERSKDGKGYIADPNIKALMFLLKTQYRSRGYIERVTVHHQVDIALVASTFDALERAGVDVREFLERGRQLAERRIAEAKVISESTDDR